jgi:Holliday junction DNA helicase RuvA
MIVALHGTLEMRGADWVQVQVGGVSLRVYVPPSTVGEFGPAGSEVHLHTHLLVRDDAFTLYGFADAESLQLFHLLLGVSGIGPRLGLALLSALGPYNLAAAIASSDEVALAQVTGVGRKTAGRIVLELEEKLRQQGVPTARAGAVDGEMVAALMALGYSAQEARSALASLDMPADAPPEERLRQALRRLGG